MFDTNSLFSMFEDMNCFDLPFGNSLFEAGRRVGSTSDFTQLTPNNSSKLLAWMTPHAIEKRLKPGCSVIVSGEWKNPQTGDMVDIEVEFDSIQTCTVRLIVDTEDVEDKDYFHRDRTKNGYGHFQWNRQKEFRMQASKAKETVARMKQKLESQGFKFVTPEKEEA